RALCGHRELESESSRTDFRFAAIHQWTREHVMDVERRRIGAVITGRIGITADLDGGAAVEVGKSRGRARRVNDAHDASTLASDERLGARSEVDLDRGYLQDKCGVAEENEAVVVGVRDPLCEPVHEPERPWRDHPAGE